MSGTNAAVARKKFWLPGVQPRSLLPLSPRENVPTTRPAASNAGAPLSPVHRPGPVMKSPAPSSPPTVTRSDGPTPSTVTSRCIRVDGCTTDAVMPQPTTCTTSSTCTPSVASKSANTASSMARSSTINATSPLHNDASPLCTKRSPRAAALCSPKSADNERPVNT